MSEYVFKKVQKFSAILWPSFLISAITNALFFVFFDPQDLLFLANFSPISAYSMGFLFLWITTALTALTTCYYLRPCHLINKKP
ncbi:hypothetical protein [uncultured Gammaproteobacteria bacterium]|jgi:hypothetical protein|uniref:hypothetical protein n=1 Tax=thiotrophic endosymbiont of Bathymodiolus puteoserpentis (Logatchev) TaxID=343240 RepID=UPI0010BB1C5E|nr:hypothetical protein [thiotrophic endosymbiont of Bathymodiolus puteoserpentis (Logatchev)]CAC9485094.1 hypothetical protein [uncultured Gammaproteobacteria bacterium]CAC9491528.1 hypothetical protein [uncultured Gammaproteobacteria bacterium]CAC9518659.1 hypothetical protein [uncultured Gammaproteobacteria bacterium]CAC9589377.1 hypothetical protein [uncultured Gammaproteobacteria bacterium]CAC9634510.1 hypothetical protein [uncultured Gammaproteobacteria bacterium]